MSNSTTDHAYKPNGYGVDKCLLCGEKITEHLTPMTLPDDIELREKLAKLEVYTTVKSEKHPLYYKDIEAILEFIATYRKKWETEARIDELNSISEPDKPGVYDPGAPEKPLTINERITELQGENK